MTCHHVTVALAWLAFALAPLAAQESLRVVLAGGDQVTGHVVSDAGGVLVLRTPYGLLSIPHGAITSRSTDPVAPPAVPGPEDPPTRPRGTESLDKAALDEVQELLARIADAINKSDGEALAALLVPPPAAAPALARLKEHAGLHRVELRAIHGRKSENGAKVTINSTELDDRGDSHVRGHEVTLERVDGGWRLAAGEADPIRRLERIARAEQAAIDALKAIHAAELAFATGKAVDLDVDGTGEFGYLQELAGQRLRGPKGQRVPPLDKPLIDPALAHGLSAGKRVATAGDYCYAIYLPGDQAALAEPSPLPDWLPVNVDRSELQFAVYAWPADYGASGQRAFAVDRAGAIYYSLSGLYSGANAPPAGAAFSRRAPAPSNLIVSPEFGLGGAPTVDGQPWYALGDPFERPAPSGKHRMHVVQRLLATELLYPDGALGKRRPGVTDTVTTPDDGEKTALVQRELGELATAIAVYRARVGRFPPSGSQSLVMHLDGDDRNGGPAERFHAFPPARLADGRFLDPWGKPYRYRHEPDRAPAVWSIGPNAKDEDGEGDDLAILVK